MSSGWETLWCALEMPLDTVSQREEAEPLFDAVIQEHRDVSDDIERYCLASAYYNRGYIKEMRLNVEAAEEDYTQAVLVDIDFDIAYYRRGQIRFQLERYRLAMDDFEACLEANPDFPNCQIALDQAMEEYSAALQRSVPFLFWGMPDGA